MISIFWGDAMQSKYGLLLTHKLFALVSMCFLCCSATSALAGSNVCSGVVHVGEEYTTVIGEAGDFAPDDAAFERQLLFGVAS